MQGQAGPSKAQLRVLSCGRWRIAQGKQPPRVYCLFLSPVTCVSTLACCLSLSPVTCVKILHWLTHIGCLYHPDAQSCSDHEIVLLTDSCLCVVPVCQLVKAA